MIFVVSIIALLSSVVFGTLAEARKNARDRLRIGHMQQAVLASRLYAEKYGTYHIPGTGKNGTGNGWFPFENGSGYTKSTAEALYDEGFLDEEIHDPLVPIDSYNVGDHYQYMRYFPPDGENSGVCYFAQLEKPKAENLEAFENAKVGDSIKNSLKNNYNMNYAQCI